MTTFFVQENASPPSFNALSAALFAQPAQFNSEATLAKYCAMNAKACADFIALHAHQTPQAFLISKKIALAERDLAVTDLPWLTITQNLGAESAEKFAWQFTQKNFLSPAEFRQLGAGNRFTLRLPKPYRVHEVLAFHARDKTGFAERVEHHTITKAFFCEGTPITLTIQIQPDSAECTVSADGKVSKATLIAAHDAALNMLGLRIDTDGFERAAQKIPLLAAAVKRQSGLRIPQAATPFEAITWAIIGQQINVTFAITLRNTLIKMAGAKLGNGMGCFPDAAHVAKLNAEDLGREKFSRAKAETILRVARLVECGDLPLDKIRHNSAQEIHDALLSIKGIGPWTANYVMLRGYGFADCDMSGDVAVRNALQRLSFSDEKMNIQQVFDYIELFKPFRSLAACHLWASLSVAA